MPNGGYFDTVFASAGSLTPVPDAPPGDGSVSYNQGYGILYSTPVGSGGFNFPRAQHNQILFDITTAIQKYQQNTVAPFITTSMNGGTAYSYGAGAMVLLTGAVYRSLVAANTDTPPSAKWLQLDTNLVQSVTGGVHTYVVADNNYNTLRSNAGAVMVDVLPGGSIAVLGTYFKANITNNDVSGLLIISVGAGGALLNGSATNTVILGPDQSTTIVSDGTNYMTQVAPGRVRLGANTTVYVATGGNDSNNGLAVGTPWLTIAKAIAFAQQSVDLNSFILTVQLADGTYTVGVDLQGITFVGGGSVTVKGNTGTPANVVLSTTSANAVNVTGAGNIITIKDMKLQTTTGGNGINSGFQATVLYGNIVFGACASAHVTATAGGLARAISNCSIAGGCVSHASATGGYVIENGITVTISTPVTMTQFCYTGIGGYADFQGSTFSGSTVTGSKYLSNQNGIINTNGAGAGLLPGTTAGSTATGGIYI